jgi:hypothetical protein
MLLIFHFLDFVSDFQSDPLSENDPWNAICARGDLAKRQYADGGYDTKVTSISMLAPATVGGVGTTASNARIVNGPTAQGQAPFTWSTSGLNDSHLGQPDVFDFRFEDVGVVI